MLACEDLEVGVGAERDRHFDELHRVGEADLGVALRDRAALPLVRIEQVGPGAAVLDRGELPRKIVRVLHAGVESEPAGRGEPVRGVADEEEAPVAKAVGDLRGHRPGRDRDDVERRRPGRRAPRARAVRNARSCTTPRPRCRGRRGACRPIRGRCRARRTCRPPPDRRSRTTRRDDRRRGREGWRRSAPSRSSGCGAGLRARCRACAVPGSTRRRTRAPIDSSRRACRPAPPIVEITPASSEVADSQQCS